MTDSIIRPARPEGQDTLIDFLRQLQDAERGLYPSRLPGTEVAAAHYGRLLARPADMQVVEHDGRAVSFAAGLLAEDKALLQRPTSAARSRPCRPRPRWP